MNKLSLLLALSAFPSWTVEQRQKLCTCVHSSYLTGCYETYNDKQLNDQQVVKIIAVCNDKAIRFTKMLDICKDFEFVK
jgi:hypothetical protein